MYPNPGNLFVFLRNSFKLARHQFWHELGELGSPDQPAGRLAAAFALGTLISFVPVPFVDSLLIALVLAKYKKVNRAAIFMSRLIWNDLLVLPLYATGYRVGSQLVGPLISTETALPGMFTPMLNFATGGVLLALSATICGFCASFLVIYLLRFADGLKRVGVDEQRH